MRGVSKLYRTLPLWSLKKRGAEYFRTGSSERTGTRNAGYSLCVSRGWVTQCYRLLAKQPYLFTASAANKRQSLPDNSKITI